MPQSTFSLIDCNIPVFDLRLFPRNTHTNLLPLRSCGHPMYHDLKLCIIPRNGTSARIEVIDSVIQRPPSRPYGIIDALFNRILRRRPACEPCRRSHELARTIVCPCCGHTILPGDDVGLIKSDHANTHTRPDLLPFAVRTNTGDVVVCRLCGLRAMHQTESHLWGGNVVVSVEEKNRMVS